MRSASITRTARRTTSLRIATDQDAAIEGLLTRAFSATPLSRHPSECAVHIHSSRPYLTAYFATQSDLAANAPARFGHACSHSKATTAAARRLLTRDFAAALVFSPARMQITRLTRSAGRVTISGLLP